MKRKMMAVTITAFLLGAAAVSAKSKAPPPPGQKVAAGNHFKVYVLKQQEQPAAANYVARAYQVIFVTQTLKHGARRSVRRIETLDAELLDPKSWEITDLDGDGFDDLRYLAQTTKDGCKVWPAMRWDKDLDRFTQGGPDLARYLDLQGQQLRSCAPPSVTAP